jgi:signal transduction histidine kinase
MAYLYYHYLGSNDQLVSIGIISFVGVAQFAPSFLGGLFWPKGHSKGARWSIISGFSLWFFLLVVPSVWPSLAGTSLGLEEFRVLVLRLGYSELSFAIYSSLGVNTLTYIALSLKYSASQAEFHQAQQFVNALSLSKSDTLLYRASADFPDLKSLLIRFLGIKHTEKVLDRYARIHGIDWQSAPQADSRIISFAERLLSEAIGPASARILIARVVDKEELSLDEVVDILEESQRVWQLNRELSRRSDQLKRVTADLRQANAKLLEFSELKDEFLYTVTHELRTPLTSIKTQAEIIYDDREMPNEDRERFLANIVADCDRLTRLINNVLDLEKYDSGNQKLALTFTSIEPLLHQVAASFKGLARKRMVEFSTEIESDLPLTYFDSDRIAQVLHNLLGNAFKYCQPGKGKVVLSARLWQGRILVEVSDNGAGIPETDRQLIFDKFYQVRNQTRRKPAGSGLGLAICKNIVQMHRGNIWVAQSEEGTGARFSFSLPLYEKDSSLSSTHLTSKVLKKT